MNTMEMAMLGIKHILTSLRGRGIGAILRIKDGAINRHYIRKLDKIKLHQTTVFMEQEMFELYRLKGRSIRRRRPL